MPVDPLLFGAGGALVGLVEGQINAYQQRSAMSSFKREMRRGIRKGQAVTEKEVYDVLASPEYQIARQFTLGTYGVEAPTGAAGFGNPVSFAGKTFVAAPTGHFQRDSAVDATARSIDQYLAITKQLEGGVDSRGNALSESERARLQSQADKLNIGGMLSAVDTYDAGQQNELVRQLGRRGVAFDEFASLRAAQLGEEPAMATATLDPAVETPLTRAFKQNIRQSATERGLYSSEAALAAEASGLAAFQYQQQQAMLPQLMQMATFGNDIYHRYEGSNINREVAFQTGGLGSYGAANTPQVGPSALSAGFGGLVQGAFAGASLGQSYLNYQNAQRPTGVQYDAYGNVRLPENAMQSGYTSNYDISKNFGAY